VHDHDKNAVTVFTHGAYRSDLSSSQLREHLFSLLTEVKSAKREAGINEIFRHADPHVS